MNLAEEIRNTAVAPGDLAICWLGQAGFLLKDSSGKILVVDPYLTNCGERMRGFKRLSPMLLRPEELTPDYYVITHLHFDHFDYDAVPVVAENSPRTRFLGPTSCQEKLAELGIGPQRRTRLDRGERYQDEAVTVQAVLADHGDMAPDAIGVLLEMGGHRIYFSGDTAFHQELFREVAAFGPDIAMLSVNGKFGNLNAREGARAAELTGTGIAVPCHCWTFAEHGGDPGEFCACIQESEQCTAACFRQGEIQLLNYKLSLLRKKETA